jgi:hypothetical protein
MTTKTTGRIMKLTLGAVGITAVSLILWGIDEGSKTRHRQKNDAEFIQSMEESRYDRDYAEKYGIDALHSMQKERREREAQDAVIKLAKNK